MLLQFSLFIFITLLTNPVWTSNLEAVRHAPSARSLRDNVHIPPCSLGCLEQFIKTNYPPSVCSDPQDVDCLCTSRSSSGYTLGEAALRCVFSACPSPGNREFQVYGICLAVENYLPNTHSQLTATAIATSDPIPNSNYNSDPTITSTSPERTSRFTLPISTTTTTATILPTSSSSTFVSSRRLTSSSRTSTLSVTSTTSTHTTSTSTTSTETSSSRTSTTHESYTSHTWATTTTTAITTTSTTSEPSTTPAASSGALSSAQLIGIYVGAGAAVVSIVAIFIFCFLRKKRRSKFQELKNPDFEIGGSMREPTPTGSLSDRPLNPIPRTPIGAFNTLSMGGVVPKPSITQQQYERTPSNSSGDTRDNLSAASRAESQLLPETPYSYRGVDAMRPNIIRTRPDNSASWIAGYPENRPTVRDVANRQRTYITRQSPVDEVGASRKSLSPQMYGLPAHPKISWSPKSHPQQYPEHAQSGVPATPRESYENPYWTTFDGTSLRPAKSLRLGPDTMAPPLRPLSNRNENVMRGTGSNSSNQRQSHSARSSNNRFESPVSKEAELTEALQAHTPTRLSPVREVDSRGSTSRSPIRNTPIPAPALPPRSERRSRVEAQNLISPLFSPNPSSSRHDSLLAKRRGTTVANRMENQFTIHQNPPPRRPVRRVSPFTTPPSSTTNNYHNIAERAGSRRPPYPDYSPFQTQSPFKYDYDHDYKNGYAGDDRECSSPGGRRVTPTKRGPDMYLRID